MALEQSMNSDFLIITCNCPEGLYFHCTVTLIDHIHNNHHVGFDIIMQISHVVCQRANIKMMLFLRKLAGLNSEVSVPKSHLRVKM